MIKVADMNDSIADMNASQAKLTKSKLFQEISSISWEFKGKHGFRGVSSFIKLY